MLNINIENKRNILSKINQSKYRNNPLRNLLGLVNINNNFLNISIS